MGRDRKNKQMAAALLLCSTALLSHNSHAVEGRRAFLGFSAGTSGYGLQAGLQLYPHLSVRLLMNSLSQEQSLELGGLDYLLDSELKMPQLLLDYHPFDNGFYLSGGLTKNGTNFGGVATLSESTEIGNVTVQPEDFGTLRSSAKYSGISPYFGIGWRSGMGRAVAFLFEAGVSTLSGVDVSLQELDSDVLSRADLDAEAAKIANDLDRELALYPHLRFGVQYRF